MYLYVKVIDGVEHQYLTFRSPEVYTGSFDRGEEMSEAEVKERFQGVYILPL